MVKCLPEFEYFTVFLKNKNIIFKIRRSKVTDYAALRQVLLYFDIELSISKCEIVEGSYCSVLVALHAMGLTN